MSEPNLQKALTQSDLIHPRSTLLAAIERVAQEIDAFYADAEQPPVFLTVLNGGVMFSGLLSLSLQTRCVFDSIHATRYRSSTSGHEVTWGKWVKVDLKGRDVLIVDDILDEGKTLSAIVQRCQEAGARRVNIAALCAKRHGRCVPGLHVDFVGVEVPDRYVYGFGMDYYELGRNLPAIYALKDGV